MWKFTTLAIAAIILLASCQINPVGYQTTSVPTSVPSTALQTYNQTLVAYDRFAKTTRIDGPHLLGDDDLVIQYHGGKRTFWFLRSVTTDQEGEPLYALVLQLYSFSWKFMNMAHSDEGESLEVERVATAVMTSGRVVREAFMIYPTREQLDRWSESGVEIKFAGQKSSFITNFPGFYLQGVLAKADQKAAPPAPKPAK